MTLVRAIAAVVIASLTVGCAYIGTSNGSPEASSASPNVTWTDPTLEPVATPTRPVETAPPTETPSPPQESTPFHTPSPSPSQVDGLEASDRFWDHWFERCFFGAFDISSSLAEITSQSQLVIRGTITDLTTRTRNDQGFQDAHITVSIEEVLKGEPASNQPGNVEVVIGHGYELEGLRSILPAHDHLWFLQQDEHSNIYYTTDYEQVSVFRDIGGVVEIIRPDEIARMYSSRHFPVPLDGTGFEDLVQRVRDLTTSNGYRSIALSRSLMAC